MSENTWEAADKLPAYLIAEFNAGARADVTAVVTKSVEPTSAGSYETPTPAHGDEEDDFPCCDVCLFKNGAVGNPIVACDGCGTGVHLFCYGMVEDVSPILRICTYMHY